MSKYIFIVLLFFTGCQNIEIKTTNNWEGRYDNLDTLKEKMNNIILNKNESIWCISNDTLEYLLNNCK